MLYVGWKDGMGWDGWMVIIGHRSSKSTFGAYKNKCPQVMQPLLKSQNHYSLILLQKVCPSLPKPGGDGSRDSAKGDK